VEPLTFLFTMPYALAGHGQRLLWMVTAVTAALAAALFAGRIAYRLTAATPGNRYAGVVAGVFAAVGLLGWAATRGRC